MSPSKVSNVDFENFHNIVNGRPVSAKEAKESYHGVMPATGEELWPVPVATEDDLNEAVDAARKAFKTWRNVPVENRRQALYKWSDRIAQYKNELGTLIMKEVGRPKAFADMEVDIIVGMINTLAALDLPVDIIEGDEKTLTTRYQPLGVVGGIAPWNFPVILSMNKVASALITGCTIIVKPSPFTPYSALKCVEIAQEFFPPGVVQALGGNDKLGPWLTAHPGVDKIAFTGSIATGKAIMAACAKTLKRVTLELGGNDVAIVLPDVDIAKVAPELVLGAIQNSGQFCVATKRILIPQSIYRPMVDAMVGFTKHLKAGPPDDPSSAIGPVQNKMQYERVKGFFEDCKKNGYNFATEEDTVKNGKGYFIPITIIDNPPTESRIVQEEPFGKYWRVMVGIRR